jgi:protein TonB
MSKQTKHRYLNSFFITTILYLVASFFLFFVFADTLVIEEKKPEEVKISIKQMMTQEEPISVEPIVEPTPIEPPAPEKKTETIVEKKIEKPKKEKHHEKKHIKEPIVQEIVETKPESTPIQPIQKVPVEQTVVKQVDTVQIENIEAEYLSKIRNIIEKNKTYPKIAKRLNQTGKVYISFTISKNGEIKNYRIHKSSNFESLDDASLEILSKIKNFDSIPSELNKESWEITVPIVYKIN